MVSYADVEKLLTARSDRAPVLSLYLEVPLEERALRELPAKAGDLIAAAPGAPAGPGAERVIARARQEADRVLDAGARQWLGHCVGIFVGDQANPAEARQLPSGLGELAVFAARPYVRPLLLAAQRHPAYWVVVVDRRHAWLLLVSPDQIELVAQPTAPGMPSPGYGGWYGLESYRVNERVTALAHQHFEDTAEMLAGAMRRAPGDVFVVGGHAATIPRFLGTVAQDERDRFAGSFPVDTATMTPAKIRALADPVIATWVAKTEEDLARRISQEPPGGLAAIGLPGCLAAVRRHAVRSLAVPSQALVPGFACRACGALGATRAELNAPESGCVHGGGDAIAVPDLIEEMAVMTIHDGGQVVAVADPPGGVAAFLRFPLAPHAASQPGSLSFAARCLLPHRQLDGPHRGRQHLEPLQALAHRGDVTAPGRLAGRSDRVVRGVLEPGLPGGEQRHVGRPGVAVGQGGQGGARGGLGLGEDRARCPGDLLGGIRRELRAPDSAGEHVQCRHVRQAAILVVTQVIGSDHGEPPWSQDSNPSEPAAVSPGT
jgi:hypothetical protein